EDEAAGAGLGDSAAAGDGGGEGECVGAFHLDAAGGGAEGDAAIFIIHREGGVGGKRAAIEGELRGIEGGGIAADVEFCIQAQGAAIEGGGAGDGALGGAGVNVGATGEGERAGAV